MDCPPIPEQEVIEIEFDASGVSTEEFIVVEPYPIGGYTFKRVRFKDAHLGGLKMNLLNHRMYYATDNGIKVVNTSTGKEYVVPEFKERDSIFKRIRKWYNKEKGETK